MMSVPQMLMAGAAGRDSGKTTFACALIRRLAGAAPIIGAKVTAIRERDGACPRGGAGCGVCTSIEGSFLLTEEEDRSGGKDTQRLLNSGARRVFWLRVLHADLEAGARALLEAAGPGALVVCESNSLRRVVTPGVFLVFQHAGVPAVKQSAREVIAHADRIVRFDGRAFDFGPERIAVQNGQWKLLDGEDRVEAAQYRSAP
jgi:hypothetical protein